MTMLENLREIAIEGEVLGEVVVELIDRVIAAESKLAELEKQEPVGVYWESKDGNERGVKLNKGIELPRGAKIFAQPKPSEAVQPIDAKPKESVDKSKAQPFERFEKLAGHILMMASTGTTGSPYEWDEFLSELNGALEVTAKSELNESVEPIGYIHEIDLEHLQETGKGKIYKDAIYDSVALYAEQVTANKAEVPSHIESEPIGFVDAEGEAHLSREVKGGYLYWGDAPPSPPLKDGAQ